MHDLRWIRENPEEFDRGLKRRGLSPCAEEVLALLHELHDETGLSILIVTHDSEVAETADRIIRMRDGLLVPEGEESRVSAH